MVVRQFIETRSRGAAANLFEIIMVIGCDPELSVPNECAMTCAQKLGGHNAPSMMTPLRPRIGEQQMKDRHGISWKQVFDGI